MGLRIEDLPPHIRDQIGATHGAKPRRKKPSRRETGERTIGRCIPHDGTPCTWTGPYGAGFERHSAETGHGRLELIDTGDPT